MIFLSLVDVAMYVHNVDGLLWSPYVIGQTIIFSCCGLFFMAALC